MTRGHPTGAARGLPLLLVLLVLTSGPTGAVHASPVEAESAVQLSSDQVLRRVAAWLGSDEAHQWRQQQQPQRALHSIQEQMDRMALEMERLETKMDLKMDRLQEVLIGRDIKWEETSRRQESQLERTALLLTEVSGQLQRLDSDIKGSLDNTKQKIISLKGQVEAFQTNVLSGMTDIDQMLSVRTPPPTSDRSASHRQTKQPGTGDVTAEWTNDVIPELRRLADGMERLQLAGQCREDADHADGGASEAEERRDTADDTEQDEDETQEDGGSTGQQTNETEDQGLYEQEQHQMENMQPALKLLEAMEKLEVQIQSVSGQLTGKLGWLDKRVGRKIQRLKEDLEDTLATMTSSLRNKFIKRRDHLEEVAGKILRLQAAALSGGGGARGGGAVDMGMVPPDNVVAALEAAIYDVFDIDLWYMLPAKLEEAVSGQGNLTTQIGQMDRDMHQGFSKLYAQMTRLSFDLVKSAQDLGTSARDHNTAQLAAMFGNISRQLHDIQLKLDD